mmetsp:Transcript_6162/g.11018  ORF Transcript_6162/g.11018 Transcript_6162/m.11018 type:complete len:281 (+) Transcript_6162:237-1079(+)
MNLTTHEKIKAPSTSIIFLMSFPPRLLQGSIFYSASLATGRPPSQLSVDTCGPLRNQTSTTLIHCFHITTMKTTSFIAAAASIALPHVRAQLRKVNYPQPVRVLEEDDGKRGLMHTEEHTVVFDECVGKHTTACEGMIQEAVSNHPEMFEGMTALDYEVLNVRTIGDIGYFNVGLRTNQEETHVAGILGDGMVFYPFDWCASANDCYAIGPWDCHLGSPLTVDQCCNVIKSDVTDPDVNGNMIHCVASPPMGSASKPIDHGRVIIHRDANNIVQYPPRNE